MIALGNINRPNWNTGQIGTFAIAHPNEFTTGTANIQNETIFDSQTIDNTQIIVIGFLTSRDAFVVYLQLNFS